MKCETANVKNFNFRKLQYYVGVFLFVSVSIILTSCPSNKYSQSDVDKYFTKERAKAKTSPISFQIPQGWHVVDANNEAFIDFWIVRNDLNVSLSLQPFYSNSTSTNLKKCLESSILLQNTKHKNKISIVIEKPIKLNGKIVLPYNFTVGGNNYRIILFEHNNKFYELTLFGNKATIKIEYFIQELVISSAR